MSYVCKPFRHAAFIAKAIGFWLGLVETALVAASLTLVALESVISAAVAASPTDHNVPRRFDQFAFHG